MKNNKLLINCEAVAVKVYSQMEMERGDDDDWFISYVCRKFCVNE